MIACTNVNDCLKVIRDLSYQVILSFRFKYVVIRHSLNIENTSAIFDYIR